MGSHFSFVTIAGVVYLHSSITSSNPGLKLADASLVTPLLIFSPVFTTLISAVFLSETPSARGWLGVGLVLVGTYWLNRNLGTDRLARAPQITGVTLVLPAGLLCAITPLFEKTAIMHTKPESPRIAAFVATTLLTIIMPPSSPHATSLPSPNYSCTAAN